MATIDDKTIIDKMIANKGQYEYDPPVALIVEYTNSYGGTSYGVTWSNEHPSAQIRYLWPTPYVQNPKVVWHNPDVFLRRPSVDSKNK